MERNSLPSDAHEAVSSSTENSKAQSRFQKLVSSARGRFALALMGAVGLLNEANKTEAANMVPGAFARAGEPLPDIPDYALGSRDLDGVNYEFTNIDAGSDEELRWLAIRSNSANQLIDAVLDSPNNGSDVPVDYRSPDAAPGGIVSQEYLAIANVPETLSIRSLLFPVGGPAADFLSSSTIYAGYGDLSGVPATVDEALAMTTGDVVTATFPEDVDLGEILVLYSDNFDVNIPGDFDGDSDVDGGDFLAWQRGESPAPLSADDLSDWQENYGTTNNAVAATQGVPEPTTVSLLGSAAALGALARRRLRNLFGKRQ